MIFQLDQQRHEPNGRVLGSWKLNKYLNRYNLEGWKIKKYLNLFLYSNMVFQVDQKRHELSRCIWKCRILINTLL